MTPTRLDRVRGCLLGCAVGDALGTPLARMSTGAIRAEVAPGRRGGRGPVGVRRYAEGAHGVGAGGAFSQRLLFAAEGLIRAGALPPGLDGRPADPVAAVHRAFLRWHATQRTPGPPPRPDGWLSGLQAVYVHSDADPTTLAALRTGIMGSPERPLNNSRSWGALPGCVPVAAGGWDAYDVGARVAAITHTHAEAGLAGGALSVILGSLLEGASLSLAVDVVVARLDALDGGPELAAALVRAIDRAEGSAVDPAVMAELGGGVEARDVLSMALYCATGVEGFEDGVALSVLSDGRSDALGAVAGALLGALVGVDGLPEKLLDALVLREPLDRLARELG